jgi:transcriptional regulator with XRE-family HTH domain
MRTTLRKYRKKQGLTLSQLAELAQMSTARLSEYENGENIPTGKLYKLTRLLHIPTGDLFENGEHEPAPQDLTPVA